MDSQPAVGVAIAFVIAFGFALSAADLPDQSAVDKDQKPATDKPIAVAGCITPDEETNQGFFVGRNTAASRQTATYRQNSTRPNVYAGRPVTVAGGLLPTVNIAAQLGSIDQTVALMATASGNPVGTHHLRIARPPITRNPSLRRSCSPEEPRLRP